MKSTASKFIAAALICSHFFIFGCTQPHEFTDANTGRILKTLSADDMMGRGTFTPGIKMAEDFIEAEFAVAGLSYVENMDSYRQEFTLTETTISQSKITIDGKTIPTERYFGVLYTDHVHFSSNNIATLFIDEGQNFRAQINEALDSDTDAVVFVHPSYEDMFSRYRGYFSRPNRFQENSKPGGAVFILADKIPAAFNVEMQATITEKPLANIVGLIEGKRTDEFVLFSAHHDHLGVRNVASGDSIANGANDDASGVTAVIELAKYFNSMPKPERSILFATFTAEEMGGYGSKYFSKQLNPDQIVAMFNIEMIGKPAVSGPNTAWITGYERSTFGQLLSKSAEGTIYEFYPDPYPDQNLFYRSDNATLARLGVPAHSISTTPIDVDEDYHKMSDEYETIDIAHLTNTIKAIAKAAQGIVSGKDTPTRVDTRLVD